MKLSTIYLDGNNLNLEDFIKVVRHGYKVTLADDAIARIKESREIVDKFVEEEKVVYGITTGFGKFSDINISKEETKTLQRNLIISHACGVGDSLSEEEVRGVMLLRANALAKGYSGIRLSTLNTLITMLNKGVHPVIPEKGSLGASGDLAPLSHMVLVMLGEGEAYYNGEKIPGKEAMDRAGIEIVELTSKEGLALINGTQVMTSIGAITLYDAMELSKISDIVASLTIEALNGVVDAYDERVHKVRPHMGQINTAENLRALLEDSEMTSRQGEIRVQDAYTLRCIPQIHGASKDALKYIEEKVNIEMNSVTDNPLIFADTREVISGGNFHGQPMALTFDFLGIALAELANVSERRLERLVNPALSGLPGFLTENGGLNSGFMIVQYSAASLVSENKILAHPASVDSIPSSANQEDHVSMGTIGARKAREILDNTRKVLAMELLVACQGIDLNGKKKLGKGTDIVYNIVRKKISKINEDRVMYKEMEKAEEILISSKIIDRLEEEDIVLK